MQKDFISEVIAGIEAVKEYKGVKIEKVVSSTIINAMIAEDLGLQILTVDAVIQQWLIHLLTQVKAGNQVNLHGLCSFKPLPKKINIKGAYKGKLKLPESITMSLKPICSRWMNDIPDSYPEE